MLVSRQLSGTAPSLDSEPYRTVPILNHRSTFLALMISFMVLSWICSLLRLYARFFVLHAPGWDDVFITLTMVLILSPAQNLGLGKSVYTMTSPELQQFLRVLYIGSATYPLSATLIKLALLFQYLRIFEAGSRYTVFCKCMIVITIAWGTAFITLRWIPCYPVAAYWDFSIKDARCWGFGSRDPLAYKRVFMAQAISTAVLDFIIFAIPTRLYFKPVTQRKTRLCLLGLFTLGLLAILCAMLRMAFVIKHFTPAATFRFDPAWYSPTTDGLACLEVHLAAICAALPVFWPLVETKWGRVFVTTEVSVTREVGQFRPYIELHSASFHRNPTLDQSHELQRPETWQPFVGDETTGLGESATVIEAPVATKRSGKVREVFGLRT
ncbi:integral membrane protein [Parachaetomium inaequale]|uniref:Integral membrane protein n=1 Tax=Parachaetomium inaequale TaxID=2588326 RepID=A0AAN6SSL3_9PEZI|nr:integral membrane protein [Parachaetomium inaequale]